MGYNTVAFILNDQCFLLEKNHKEVMTLLTHPEMGGSSVGQALTVLPPFHASERNFYMAGGNCIEQLKNAKFYKRNGKSYVTLELPEWMK